MTNRAAIFVLTCLLAISLPASGAVAGGPTSPASLAGQADSSTATSLASSPAASASTSTVATTDATATIHQSVTLSHLPDRPGEFAVSLRFEIPDAVTELEVRLADASVIRSTDGFGSAGEATYEWDGSTERPGLTYRMPANRTGVEHRSDGASTGAAEDDGYSFVDTGAWGVVAVPETHLEWWQTAPVTVDRTVAVDGPGATGGSIAFFGEVTEHERAVGDDSFRLVVPDAAALAEDPEAILDALEAADASLPVASRSDGAFVVAVPADGADWVAEGIQHGQADAWIVDDASLEAARNVWIHEFVHTRQDFAKHPVATTDRTEWLIEGQADYYAALRSLEQDLIDFAAFRSFLDRGTRSHYDDAVLVDRTTWAENRANYAKGALVYGELDRQLRLATDGERTMLDVFRALNVRGEDLSEEALLEAIETEGGEDLRALAAKYTRTDAVPDAWSARAHREAFGQETAAFDVSLAAEPITVSGPVRTSAHAPADLPAVVPGETVTVDVAVENVGDRAGTARVSLLADWRLADERTVDLSPGASETVSLTYTPEETGAVTLEVAGERFALAVLEPAHPAVTDFTVDPTEVAPGKAITLSATLENDADRPAERTVAFRTPEGVADEPTVTLAPGAERTVETTVRFDAVGSYEVAVDDRVEVVRVTDAANGPSFGADGVAGFGAPAALLAVVLALAVGRTRR